MPSRRVTIKSSTGPDLAAIIDTPSSDTRLTAIFAHCFTCTKDLKAIVKISRRLAENGITVVRFDFRGLGGSAGKFADSNFLTNLEDLKHVADWTAANVAPAQLLIGHSLGGAAAMASVMELESVAALVTLASPSDTFHLADFLSQSNPDIDAVGQGDVVIGGIRHTITRQMLDSMRQFDLKKSIEANNKPYLILHSPADKTVVYDHARRLLEWGSGAKKSLVTLNDCDHLFTSRPQDTKDVGDLIASWATHWCN